MGSTGRTRGGVGSEDRLTLCIAVVGALAYSSWPLGFLVNPSLAGTALASGFEARSQPFSWLFILLDCAAGLCTVIVFVRLLLPRPGRRPPGKALVVALLGYAAFGVTSAVDAVVPLSCGGSSAQACAAQLWPITPDDLLTGIAVLGLFVAAAVLVVRMVRGRLPLLMPATVAFTVAGWSALGLVVLVGSISPAGTATAQYAFLTLTSLLTILVASEATALLRPAVSGSPREPAAAPTRVRARRVVQPVRGLPPTIVALGPAVRRSPGPVRGDRRYRSARPQTVDDVLDVSLPHGGVV